MADGKFLIGKPSGGVTTVTVVDGVDNTNLVLPLSGTVATEAYVNSKMVLGTAIASTSGTSIDFTGIPSWAKRISILFKGVSSNGNSGLLVQIGSTSIQTTGYSSSASAFLNGTLPSVSSVFTTGFVIFNDNIADSNNIKMTIDLMSNFTYISTHNGVTDDVRHVSKNGSGVVSLPSALDRIRITSGNVTETFDAGQINIMYEG